jgi:hypothetical protein
MTEEQHGATSIRNEAWFEFLCVRESVILAWPFQQTSSLSIREEKLIGMPRLACLLNKQKTPKVNSRSEQTKLIQ